MPLFAFCRYTDAGRLRELLLEDTSRSEAAPSLATQDRARAHCGSCAKYISTIYTHINVAAMACWWGRRVRSKHIPTLTQTHAEKEQRTDVARAHLSESSKDGLHNNTGSLVVLARGLATGRVKKRARLGHASFAVAHKSPAARRQLLAPLPELRS